jgi:hypothetical protein
MTLGEKGLTCHTIYFEDEPFGNTIRRVPHEGFEVHLNIPDRFDIIAPEKGKLYLRNADYLIRVERMNEEQVLITVERKPDNSPILVGQTLVASWLNMPFTRHLLGLNCTCLNHCQKCGAPLRNGALRNGAPLPHC